jgi:hypothetical protein
MDLIWNMPADMIVPLYAHSVNSMQRTHVKIVGVLDTDQCNWCWYLCNFFIVDQICAITKGVKISDLFYNMFKMH